MRQKSPVPLNQQQLLTLVEKFFSFSVPKATTAKSLAIELATRTRFLRDQVIEEELIEERISGVQTLEGYYEAFKKHLIESLTLQQFSDLFAQTITYGLFAARSRAGDDFNRKLAHEHIPPTIGILRDVFRFISSTDLPENLERSFCGSENLIDQPTLTPVMYLTTYMPCFTRLPIEKNIKHFSRLTFPVSPSRPTIESSRQ